jgi:FkbM family methyltransferase
MIAALRKRCGAAYVAAGYPLLPLTRWARGPLRWIYHRSPLLRHDSRPFLKPRLLQLAHKYLVRDLPAEFTIHGGRIKFRSAGSLMSVQAYYVGEVEYHLVQYVLSQLRPGFVMFDVGAHHGVFSLVAAYELRARGWKGTIHSFEPSPENFALLEHNVRQNGLSEWVTPHQEAVADAPSRRQLVLVGEDNSGNYIEGVAPAEVAGARCEVAANSLDSWLNAVPAVHLIKMDIQGAEPLALAGAKKLIERFHPVLVLEAMTGWPGTPEVTAFLRAARYQVHGVDAVGRVCEPDSPRAYISWDRVALPPASGTA